MHRMHPITDTRAVFNCRMKSKALALAMAVIFSQTAFANPVGPSVASGTASFATSGSTLTVTNSPNAIINWQQFNIGQNETTRFAQQSALSSVLNRIGGQNASQIMGTLQSNGKVFLINPNGILFGAGSVIDVAGLVASSLNLSDANFLANRLTFNGGGFGAVSNLGNISTPLGGRVYLIGSDVSNQGVITSPQGQVLLAAGSSVSLIDSAGPELSVTLTANGNKAVNLGTVTAAGGRIDMFGALVEQAGVLRADSASVDTAGNIILKATQSTTVSGEISATNSAGSGGKVQVLGDQVALTSTARIDVSGVGAGGTALIGGDYQGKNTAVQNATLTTIAAGATIKADALSNGNGGRVIVWSDDKAVFDGFISARGGANGGDGGFVETSGKQSLSITSGMVNTLASRGTAGTWLLDPASICVDSVAGSSCSTYVSSYGSSYISNTTIGTALNNNGQYSLDASDFIAILGLDLRSILTRSNTNLWITAPHIYVDAGIWAPASNSNPTSTVGLNVYMNATGSSASTPYGSMIVIDNAMLSLGNALTTTSLRMHADKEIRFNNTNTALLSSRFSTTYGGAFAGWSTQYDSSTNTGNFADIRLSAPKIVLLGETKFRAGVITGCGTGPDGNTGCGTSGELMIETNRIEGNFSGFVGELGIKTYTPGFNIYLGKNNIAAECGVTGLCLTNQVGPGSGPWATTYPSYANPYNFGANYAAVLAGTITGMTGVSGPKLRDLSPAIVNPDGDIYLGGFGVPWGVVSQGSLDIIGRNITLNNYVNGSFWTSPYEEYPFNMIASGTFTNLGTGVTGLATGKSWMVAVGNYAGSNFGNMATDATVIKLSDFNALDHWERNIPHSGNVILDFSAATDLCTVNPAACRPPDPPAIIQPYTPPTIVDPIGTTTQGLITFDANLKIAGKEGDAKDDGKSGSGAKGELKVAGDDKKGDEKKKVDVARARQEARAAEERKSPAELKREAQQARTEATKLDGEAKKTAAEGKKAEAEARKAEGEQKKAEAEGRRADTEARKAEEGGKKADAEAKQHDSTAKQAANDAKSARSADAKAAAEAKKADAESKKADAESRKTDAEGKKVAAEGKKSEAEHKRADTEVKQTEGEQKRVESESKQAEANSKKAEADHKLALAEVKEAKTPQQKAAAEKRADDKRVEAIQEKAKAEVKKERAEVKKAEVEAKKAESEQKKTEADAKKIESDSKHAEVDSKRSESQSKKSEADGKRAEADAAKAKQEGKGGEEKKAEAKKAEAEQKKAVQEKRAESKKAEAEKKLAEAEGKKREAEQKRTQAAEKKVAAEKKQAEHRERAVKSFAKAAVAAMAPERLAEVIAMRHEFKAESLKPALNILERNPKAADLPGCASGGGDVCVPAQAATAQRLAQQVAQLPAPRIPTVSFLPQIERKIAIVVAINNYRDTSIPPLDSAVPDGEAVGKLMQDKMGYDVRIIRDAGKADIVKALNAVGREVGPNDSVTVYYAGHGYQMDDKSGKPGEGYWIPADGSSKEPSNWISNSDVSRLLGNIPAKQVMLVSDSCYSGTFAKEQKITTPVTADPARILAKRSVVVMSSGGEEPVSDEGKEGHSIFAWSLMNSMKNVDKFDSGSTLYEGVRKQVIEEFPQVPQYAGSTSAGHVSGGDYLFEARRY